jgi:hypothetical protein
LVLYADRAPVALGELSQRPDCRFSKRYRRPIGGEPVRLPCPMIEGDALGASLDDLIDCLPGYLATRPTKNSSVIDISAHRRFVWESETKP